MVPKHRTIRFTHLRERTRIVKLKVTDRITPVIIELDAHKHMVHWLERPTSNTLAPTIVVVAGYLYASEYLALHILAVIIISIIHIAIFPRCECKFKASRAKLVYTLTKRLFSIMLSHASPTRLVR